MKYIRASFAILLFASSGFSQISASFTKSDSIVCVNDCITFQSTSTGDGISSYTWTFNGGTPSSFVGENPPVICYPTVGNYSVRLDISNGSQNSTITTPLRVGRYPDSVVASGEATIEMGASTLVLSQGYGGSNVYNWLPQEAFTCQGCKDAYASPLTTQYVIVEYFSNDMCAITDSVLITVNYKDVIDLPNSFSPNNDGVNEKLFVKGPGIKKLDFKVFDRYGSLIYQTNDQREGWDGTFNGQLLNPGTFLWTIEYTLIDESTNKKSGTISLIK